MCCQKHATYTSRVRSKSLTTTPGEHSGLVPLFVDVFGGTFNEAVREEGLLLNRDRASQTPASID